MGSFIGHSLPGTFFLVVGLWWTYCIFFRLFRHRSGKGRPFQNTAIYPLREEDKDPRPQQQSERTCLQPRCADYAEAYFKIISASLGLLGELGTGFQENRAHTGQELYVGNGQHMTMYAFFGFSGVVDLLMTCESIGLPPNTDYAFGFLAFAVEAVLFQFHLHGRTMLNVTLHHLLVYVIWACAVGLLLEMRWRDHPLCGLARAFFTILQGTWFWQVGSILYNPFSNVKWNGDDHDSIMLAVVIFSWHVFAVFLLQVLIGLFVSRRVASLSTISAAPHSMEAAKGAAYRPLEMEDRLERKGDQFEEFSLVDEE